MQSSFFEKNKFKIIERKIILHDLDVVEKNEVVHVYDLTSWKLTSSSFSVKDTSLPLMDGKLATLKEKHTMPFGVCVTTSNEVNIAAKYADFLYIPGEFCRQSDVLDAAKNTQIPFIVEKGVFLSPNDIKRLCDKIKGSDFALVECGSANGYSDSVLDPRSLHIIKNTVHHFGVSLSDLLSPEGSHYSHKPQWLMNGEFVHAFIQASKAFNVSFFVIKNYGQGDLISENILNLVR